ncbi:MAG: DMT family transporter [Bilophila wadsworthia]
MALEHAFLTILPFAGRSALRSLPSCGTWGKVILMALLGITCFNTFIYQAGRPTPPTCRCSPRPLPSIMAAIAHLFLREQLTFSSSLCGALCVIILVSRGRLGTLLGLRFAQGDLWMLLSVFLFAVYSLMLRCRPKAFPQKAFLALLIGIGVLGLIPPLLWQAADTGLSPLDGSILSALIYIGVGASVVSFLAWSLAIERIGMVRAGIIYNSIPLFASLEATLFLGESITLPQMIGGVLIIGGICYASFGDLYAARRLLK